jgi:hypothetical protein
MKKLTIKILLVFALVAGAVTGSMIMSGVTGHLTAQACDMDYGCNHPDTPPDKP